MSVQWSLSGGADLLDWGGDWNGNIPKGITPPFLREERAFSAGDSAR